MDVVSVLKLAILSSLYHQNCTMTKLPSSFHQAFFITGPAWYVKPSLGALAWVAFSVPPSLLLVPEQEDHALCMLPSREGCLVIFILQEVVTVSTDLHKYV